MGSGFENDVLIAKNVNFDPTSILGPVQPPFLGQVTTNGQLLIGSTAAPFIQVGTLTSPSSTITIGYSAPNITLDLVGGGVAIEKVNVQTGTTPVVPSSGAITLNGATVLAGTNPVRTDGTNANTIAIEVQKSQAIAAADATKIGLSNFDSTKFTVDATGFVSTSGSGVVNTLSDDVGTSITPTAGNIQLVGHLNEAAATKFSTVVAGSHLATINPMSSSRWIVDPLGAAGFNGTHQTITAALASATSGDTVFLMPGTYNESPPLKVGVNIAAYDCDALNPNVIINGKCTLSTAGTVGMSGINFQTNSDFFLAVTGSVASIVWLKNCYLNCLNNTGISHSSSSASSSIKIINCRGDLGTTGIGLYTSTSAGPIDCDYVRITNTGASTTASSTSTANCTFRYCKMDIPFSTSTGGSFTADYFTSNCNAINTTAITTAGTGSANFNMCFLAAGSASAISVGAGTSVNMNGGELSSSNASVIAGSGTITIGDVNYSGSSSSITTTTQAVRVTQKGAYIIALPAGDYTQLATDEIIGATTSGARAITLMTGPVKGQVVTIKDVTGSAAANNITITPAAGTIDGAATKVINTNYGSLQLFYSGTAWFTF